jgi:hypothetical protein
MPTPNMVIRRYASTPLCMLQLPQMPTPWRSGEGWVGIRKPVLPRCKPEGSVRQAKSILSYLGKGEPGVVSRAISLDGKERDSLDHHEIGTLILVVVTKVPVDARHGAGRCRSEEPSRASLEEMVKLPRRLEQDYSE